MKRVYLVGLLLILASPLVSCGRSSQWTEEDWQPLVDEPSRQELQQQSLSDTVDAEAVQRKFRFPRDTTGVTGVFGIDVSHYTASLPYTKLAPNGVRFVYAKATHGAAFKDPKFKTFWPGLGEVQTSAHVYRGAYHFLSAADDGELQAERFVAYVKLQGGFKAADLPPVLDLEWDKATATGADRWKTLTPAQIVTKALKFLKRVEALTGRVPMIYTSKAWWNERGIPASQAAKLASYKIWAADYSAASIKKGTPQSPVHAADVWQFTDEATLPGLSGLDANFYPGTLEQFLRAFSNAGGA